MAAVMAPRSAQPTARYPLPDTLALQTPSPLAAVAARTPMAPTVRLELEIDLHYEVSAGGADFVFNIHAAQTPHQTVHHEQLQLSQDVPYRVDTDAATANRLLRLHAQPGPLEVRYRATVDIRHHTMARPEQMAETPVGQLPTHVLGYIYPSRYCQSDRLMNYAFSEFGHIPPGYGRVQAICNWVRQHVRFASNTSDSQTSAVDTLIARAGVCRDFSHLMIAMCRAMNIPARFTTGTDFGADPALGPPDFHAYVEVYLGDRWYLFDPSGTAIPMGMLRFGTGRDAADVAFATMFGAVKAQAPVIRTHAVDDPARGFVLPHHCTQALSTDAGPAATSALEGLRPAVA